MKLWEYSQVCGLIFSVCQLIRGIRCRLHYDTPEPPFNLTIESLDSTSVSITWKVHDKYTYAIQSLELTIHSIPDDRVTSSRVQFAETTTERLSGRDRSAALQGLHPATQYQIHIVAVSTHDKKSNMSEIITFRTLPDSRGAHRRLLVHPGEVTIVVLILIAWFCAIALFLQKWGRIRIVHNQEPRFKREFKNLDSIKVVKRPTDSVIYRSYPRQVSKTMAAREKRIERMNTMPNIKIAELENKESAQRSGEQEEHKKVMQRFKTLATLPVIEMDEEGESEASRPSSNDDGWGRHSRQRSSSCAAKEPVIELDEMSSDRNHQSES